MSARSGPPSIRVRTQRRWGLIKVGLLLALTGLAALIAGSVVAWVNDAAQVALPITAREGIPGSTTFDAEDRAYAIVVARWSSAEWVGILREDHAVRVRCEVNRADGTTAMIDGSRRSVRVETDMGSTVGTFEASAGMTTVTCEWIERPSHDYRFAISSQRPGVMAAGLVGVVGGIALVIVAVPLVWIGFRGRPVVERESGVAPEI